MGSQINENAFAPEPHAHPGDSLGGSTTRQVEMTGVPGAEDKTDGGRQPGGHEEAREDAACIERIQRGDQEAFGELASRYATRIFTHLVRMTGNHEEAEDLTQDTFIKAIRYLSSYDAKRPFRNWLYAIATNVGIDAQKRNQRRKRFLADPEKESERMDTATVVERPAMSVCDSNVQRETAEQLRAAMNRLPPRSAALLHLHYFEGMTLQEAGKVLSMGKGAAKVALCRARKRLREMLVINP